MGMQGLANTKAYLQVLGCLLKDSSLVDDLDRPLDKADFDTDRFYSIIYVAIHNLYFNGCTNINELEVDSYLSAYPEQHKIFSDNNGLSYIVTAREMAQIENYDFNYHIVRKYSLLRYYENLGLDTRFIYDGNKTDALSQAEENAKFDELTENKIVEMIEGKFVIDPNMKFCTSGNTVEEQAAKGGKELIRKLMEVPDFGIPLNNEALNTIARGARLGCVYMDSFPSGEGKSRTAIGHAMHMSVPYKWDKKKKDFVETGISEPTVYISTEMSTEEVKTMMYATVSGINEEKILYGMYDKGELERVDKAIEYIESSPIYIVHLPDFDIQDVCNIIKKYHREFNVSYCYFDYLQNTVRLMTELSTKSKIQGLKEHQMLLLFITKLKAIAEELNIFIWTSSQLSDEVNNVTKYDQHLLAGAKSLVNKLDVGIISKRVEGQHIKKIENILHNKIGVKEPNYFHSIYKVRRGKLTKIMVWCYIDLGVMTEEPLFVTDFNYQLVDVDFTTIKVNKKTEKKIEEIINEHSTLESMEKYDEDEKSATKIEEQKTENTENTTVKTGLMDW